MAIGFCINPCVSPSAARWWETLASTPYAEVQRHKLQATASSFTSLMVNGVRSGVKKDPHADYSYRIIKSEPPQLVLAVAETEEDILQSWAALRRFFFSKSPAEIQAIDWMSLGAKIVESESRHSCSSLDGTEGWVDVPTTATTSKGEAAIARLGRSLAPFDPIFSHVLYTLGWKDPYRSLACLIIVFNAWSRDVLMELLLAVAVVPLLFLQFYTPPASNPSQLGLNVIASLTQAADVIQKWAVVLALVPCSFCCAWLLVRFSYIHLGPEAWGHIAFIGIVLLFVLGFIHRCTAPCPPSDSAPPRRRASQDSQVPLTPTSPAQSQVTDTGSPTLDDGTMSMQSAIQSGLTPPGLQVLPPGILAPSCELPESARRVLIITNSDGWQTVSSSDGILYESKSIPWAAIKAVRFTTTIQCTLTELYDFLTNLEQLMKLDPLLAKFEQLNVAEDTDVALVYDNYSLFKAPIIGVSKRDFVTEISNFFMQSTPDGLIKASSREGFNTDEKSVLIQASCSIADDVRPPSKGAVRGTNFAFGYIARPTDSGVHLTQVMSIDPRGWLPPAAIDASNKVQIDKLKKMQRILNKQQ